MKTISCIIALTCCIQVAAQSGNGFFDGMAEQERDEYLVAKAKEVVLNFGPDYYREYGEPEISEVMVYNSDNMWREHNGKRFYTVTFRYDKTKESLEWDYAAFVEIWENDGQPKEVYFGNGAGFHFFKKPYSEQIREGITPDDIVRYQPARERVVVMDERR